MDNFGPLLKALREKENMTQAELATLLHTSRASLSRWENGSSFPDILTLRLLSDILHISSDDLLHPTETLQKISIPSQNNEQAEAPPSEFVTESTAKELFEQVLKSRAKTRTKKYILLISIFVFLLIAFFFWYKYDLNRFRLIETHTNVETPYGSAYELVFCHKLPSVDKVFVTHAKNMEHQWKNGIFKDATEDVLVVTYYLSTNDINSSDKIYFQMYFFPD